MKNITKHIKKLNIFIIAITLFSCGDDFLSPPPTSVLNAVTFFESEADLESAAVNMYDGIQGINSVRSSDNHGLQREFYVTEMRSDNTRTKSSEGEAAQFESFNIEATNGIIDDYYRSFYNVIFRANTVLAHLDVADSPASSKKYEGEAKFIRAYAYFNLVRLYGDIPLVTSIISTADTDLQYTRVATSTVYDLIESDLLNAIDSGLDNSTKLRGSKAAAQALLAKLYLTTGTNYLQAQLLCEAVMGSGFMLEPNFKDVFFTEQNNEIIFAIGYEGDSADSQNFSGEWLNAVGQTSGVNYTTADVRTALDALGGNRTPYSYRVDSGQPTQFQVVKYLPEEDTALGIPATVTDRTQAGNDWIVLRYADVLLMHVEAIMAGGNDTSAGAALNSFELIRLRAGLIGDDNGTITKQELLDERRVELAFENHRLFDLIRFNEAQNVLSAFSTATGGGFNSSDLLLPIPQREINLSNGVLSQNPGY